MVYIWVKTASPPFLGFKPNLSVYKKNVESKQAMKQKKKPSQNANINQLPN